MEELSKYIKLPEIYIIDDINFIIDFIEDNFKDSPEEKKDVYSFLDSEITEETLFMTINSLIFNKKDNSKDVLYSMLIRLNDNDKQYVIDMTRDIKFSNGGNLLMISTKDKEILEWVFNQMFPTITNEGKKELFSKS